MQWTPSRLIRWAEQTGPATGHFVAQLQRRRPHPEQGYRACLGLMRLGRRYGAARLEAASARATALGSYRYRTVTNILASAQDRLPLDAPDERPTPAPHANIRRGELLPPRLGGPMLIEQTLDKLNAMKLGALAEAVQQQRRSGEAATLSFEDRLGLLVDTEWSAREQRKLTRRLRVAKLRYPASLEAVDFTPPRRLKSTGNRSCVSAPVPGSPISTTSSSPAQPASARASSPVPSSSGRVGGASRRATCACRGCCTRWPSAAVTAHTPASSRGWPSPTCSRSTTGCSRRCATPNAAT